MLYGVKLIFCVSGVCLACVCVCACECACFKKKKKIISICSLAFVWSSQELGLRVYLY